MKTAPPVRTPEQRRKSLAHANEIRVAAAALKNEIFALPREEGARLVAETLLTPPELLSRLRVRDLVAATRGLGEKRALTLMADARVADRKRLGGLSGRQRLDLAERLRRWGVEGRHDE